MNPIADAMLLAEQSLSEAVELAKQLPHSLGTLLISLAQQLQGQIKHDIGC
jgi:hypothetical protein